MAADGQVKYMALGNGELCKTTFDVLGICCGSEVPVVERLLRSLHGVERVSVNVPSKTVTVLHDPILILPSNIVKELNQAGMQASVPVAGQLRNVGKWPSPYTLASGFFLAISLFQYLYHPLRWVALGAIAVGILPIMRRTVLAVRNLMMDINVLMFIAVAGAIALGDYLEGGTIVFLFTLVVWLESRSNGKAQAEISSLLTLAPQTAVIEESGEIVDVKDVSIHTVLSVKAGEAIPLDGIVVSGSSSVDESSVTGESLPVEKEEGANVWAGTMNLTGYLSIKTVTLAEDSTMARMVKLVEEAQSQRSSTEEFMQTFAKYYTPVIVVAALGVTLAPLFDSSLGIRESAYKALVLVVAACPCALVISTPVATACGLAHASRLGILIKGGKYLEALGKVKAIAFDKTGTLTEGIFRVVDVKFLEPQTLETQKWLSWISSLESRSSHPMSVAIVSYCRQQGIEPLAEVKDFSILEGEGICGVVDTHKIYIGNARLSTRLGWTKYIPNNWDIRGATVGYVGTDEKFLGAFSVADNCRPEAAEALQQLKKLGIKLAMLTGDTAASAGIIEKQVGEIQVYSQLLPEDKVRIVGDLKKVGKTSMIGDGINDAPALAAADIGIAMGVAGSAVAMETADIALMSNDIRKIAAAVKLGRRTMRRIYINVAISIVAKVFIIVLTAVGLVYLWIAVLADVGTSMLVTFNSMFLLKGAKRHKNGRTIEKSEVAAAADTKRANITCDIVKVTSHPVIYNGCASLKPRTNRCCQNLIDAQFEVCTSGDFGCASLKPRTNGCCQNLVDAQDEVCTSGDCSGKRQQGNVKSSNSRSFKQCCNSSSINCSSSDNQAANSCCTEQLLSPSQSGDQPHDEIVIDVEQLVCKCKG